MAEALLSPVSNPPSSVDIYDALTQARGNLAETVRILTSLGFTTRRSSVKERIDRTPELLILLDDLRESVIDRAEANKFAEVEKGDPSASTFILSTLGRSRGYSQGVAGTGKDGAIIVEIRQFEEPKSDG